MGALQNGQLFNNPRRLAAKMQPSHILFMQQTFTFECLSVGNSIRRKQIVHQSPSGLSWPLVINLS